MRPVFGAALLFLGMALVATLPGVLYFNERFIGDVQGDFWKHAWGHWWVWHEMVQEGRLPLYCRMLNHPSGGYLFIADPFNGLSGLLLLGRLPLVSAYNTLVILNLAGGALAAWALARHFTGSSRASLVAGAVYGFSPYMLAYPVVSGVTETLNSAWIPLFVLFLHRTLEDRRLWDLLLAALSFFLVTFSCWYYGQFMGVYAAFAVLWMLGRGFFADGPVRLRWRNWRQRESTWRDLRNRLGQALLEVRWPFLRMVGVFALGVALVFPFAMVFQMVVSDPANLVMPDKAPVRGMWRFEDFLGSNAPWSYNARGVKGHHNHTNLAGLLLPGKENATVTLTIDRLTRVHYLGYLALLLAAYGWRSPERRWLWYWTSAGLFFVALSTGPIVHFSDFSPAGFVSPLYLAMFYLFPLFHKVAIPFRFLVLALLSLGVLAAFGLREWLARRPERWRTWLACGAAWGVLAETCLLSPAPWPLPTSSAEVPAFYRMAALEPGGLGIIDYPPERADSQLIPGEYFYYQTVHLKPIPYRTSGVLSPEVARNPLMEELAQGLKGIRGGPLTEGRVREGARRLEAIGFRYLVLHSDLLPPLRQKLIEERLEPVFGEPARFGDGVVVYLLAGVAAEAPSSGGTARPGPIPSPDGSR